MSAQQHPRESPEPIGSAGAPLPSPQPVRPGPVPVQPQPEPEPPTPEPKGPGGFLALVLLLLGAGAGWWLFQQMEAADAVASTSGGGPGAALVRTAKVSTGDLDETIRLSGTITAQSFAAIRAPQISRGRRSQGGGGGAGIAGGGGGGGGSSSGGGLTIIEMAAPGSTVQKGQMVAGFDRQSQQQLIDDQQANVVQANALIDSTRAKLMIEMETKRQEMVTAKAEYEKAKMDLRTAEVRSEIEAEVLKNVAQQAEAAYKQLEREVKLLEDAHAAALRQAEIDKAQEEVDLKRAELNAQYLEIHTPIPGVVVMQTIFRGGSFAQVALGDEVYPGAYFMQIVDPASMVLEARVNQADSQKIRVGASADVRLDAYPDKVWRGRVESIAAMTGGGGDGRSRTGTGDYVREITVTVKILDASELIIPDLSASADVRLTTHEQVVIAPREALEQEGDGWFVRVRSSGGKNAFERRPVEVASKTDTQVAVARGLEPGEEVALEPPPATK
ncbi:MAG: efflux RND transporter periplasmic adaptor subunit [Bryobacterales bacterium]|nr:efflux RND transporter periplasmic adaptor subunit [Bryobacterales bacterium]